MRRLALFIVLLSFACKTAQPAAPPPPKSEFKNLKVLDPAIQKEQLLATMRGFTRGLGVRCGHCHVQTATDPRPEFDFPNDEKQPKRVAREMIRMVAQINGTFIPRAQKAAGENPPPEPENLVSCWTCHRGKEEPESPPPPEQH